jgi:DNA polymerase III alpha subunit (gram-positive type)
MGMTYVELQASSHFSFLRGVSSAEELFSSAALMGYPALGVADRSTADSPDRSSLRIDWATGSAASRSA